MRRRSLGRTGWLFPCALAALFRPSIAAAQPLEGDATGRLPDVEGEAVPAEGAEPAAPGDAAGAPSEPSEGAEVPTPPTAAPATGSETGEDAAREGDGEPPVVDGLEGEAGVPLEPAYEPPSPPPSSPPEGRRGAGGGAKFRDEGGFGLVYWGGGYPWGVSEGKGGIRFEGRGSFTLGGQVSFGLSPGWGFVVGGEFSTLFTQSKVGDSEVPAQFVESFVLPFGAYFRMGDGALLEVEGLLALGGMRFENVGKMEIVAAIGGRIGALIAVKELSRSTFFVNPRVDVLAHQTENIETVAFVVPTVNLGFSSR